MDHGKIAAIGRQFGNSKKTRKIKIILTGKERTKPLKALEFTPIRILGMPPCNPLVVSDIVRSTAAPPPYFFFGERCLLLENPETLSLKLLGIFEISASGSFAIVLATLLAAALIIRVYRR